MEASLVDLTSSALSRVGSWSYFQLLDWAGKACQRQFILPLCKSLFFNNANAFALSLLSLKKRPNTLVLVLRKPSKSS